MELGLCHVGVDVAILAVVARPFTGGEGCCGWAGKARPKAGASGIL